MAEPNELEAWREVHNKLLIACELAQEAVDAERMQHRYWMEELAANLVMPAAGTTENNNSSDNSAQQFPQLSSTSVWSRATAPKTSISKKKMAQLYKKRRGKAEKGKRKASALRAKKGKGEDSSHGPPRKLRIKMKKHKTQPAKPPPPPPAPAARGDEQLYEETEDEDDDDDDDDDDEDDEEANDYHQLHHQQQQQQRLEPSSAVAVASSHNDSNEYSANSGSAQQYVGQNPLQMMAAVAFGTSQPYSPVVETPSYSAYMSSNNNNNRGSFTSRASNIATYGSLQDIADEDDDEDAF